VSSLLGSRPILGVVQASSRASLIVFGIFAAFTASAEPDAIDDRDADWWRAAMESRASELASHEAAVAECEEREAPPAYDAVDGYVTRSRGDGRLRYVEVKRCDDERRALEAAQRELERFEDEARRAGVPPGWLR
jgi:hypothetical protein